jgi:uncharacterized protein
MLADTIRTQMFEAMKRRDEVAKNILQVALGDIQSEAARSGAALNDEQAVRIIKKIMKSNDESLAVVKDPGARSKLERENVLLQGLVPQSLSVEQIVAALGPVEGSIRTAASSGQATGVAMRHLKTTGQPVDGRDVAQAVQRLRGSAQA